MVTPLIGTHEGVSCDGCSVTAFLGNRYKCLRCGDYDLCHGCYITKHFGEQAAVGDAQLHDESHPMQLILSSIDFEAVYEGDPTRRYDERKIVSFTCPYCNITGLTDRQFGSHVTAMHPDPPNYTVICPLCIGIADMEHSHSRETENLRAHWVEHHSNSYFRVEPVFRTDPLITRPPQRRPMLARRTQRATVGRGGNRTAGDELTPGVAELIRTMRPDASEDFRRMAEILNTPSAATIRNAQRLMAGVGLERAAVVVETAAAFQDAGTLQIVRPLATVPVYPPTSDESGDETPQPAADSADGSENGSDEEDVEEVFEDDELKNDEFWKTLKTRIGAEEVALVLHKMKTNAKLREEKEKLPSWTSSLKPIANPAITTADAEGEQGWLGLIYDTTPLKSTGCGGYWSDKRFLRPRKMQREQSVASSNAEIMEKAEVAMALCRASCARHVVFSDPTKPDVSLKEALQHLNLGEKPEKMMEYQAAEELVQMPERDPITTGEVEFEMPDFTARGYGQIVDGNVPLGVVPEADEAIVNSDDEDAASSDNEEDEQEDDEEDDSQDSSIPEEMSIP